MLTMQIYTEDRAEMLDICVELLRKGVMFDSTLCNGVWSIKLVGFNYE